MNNETFYRILNYIRKKHKCTEKDKYDNCECDIIINTYKYWSQNGNNINNWNLPFVKPTRIMLSKITEDQIKFEMDDELRRNCRTNKNYIYDNDIGKYIYKKN